MCGLNDGAANVVCRMLGYDFGAIGSSPCASYGSVDLCGAREDPVAMKGLHCTSSEMDLRGSHNQFLILWVENLVIVPDANGLRLTRNALIMHMMLSCFAGRVHARQDAPWKAR